MALTAQIALSILAHETSSGDLSRTLRATPANYAIRLTDGTGANQAQVVWSDARTATTSNDDLTLWNLSDTRDGASVTVAFTQVKLVYVKNTSSTQVLRIGGASGVGAFAGLPVTVYGTLPPAAATYLPRRRTADSPYPPARWPPQHASPPIPAPAHTKSCSSAKARSHDNRDHA